MNQKILFITALHGNEQFGTTAVENIAEKLSDQFDHVVGNPKAVELDVRFTDDDLNRIAPGDMNSDSYEKKRAAELIELSGKYSAVIDIHGTMAKSGIFTLVTNPTLENLLLAISLPIENIVIWAAKESLESGPVTQFTKCPAVEIECGPKDDPKILSELTSLLENYLKSSNPDLKTLLNNTRKRCIYLVTGNKYDISTEGLEEFKKFELDGKELYPLLINSYKSGSVRVMEKLDLFNLLAY